MNDTIEELFVVSSNGLEYANFVAEQLGGQAYEVQTTIKLSKV